MLLGYLTCLRLQPAMPKCPACGKEVYFGEVLVQRFASRWGGRVRYGVSRPTLYLHVLTRGMCKQTVAVCKLMTCVHLVVKEV